MPSPRRTIPAIVVAAVILAVPTVARAAPGDLDHTFGGGDGVAKFHGAGEDAGQNVLRQSNGKIVVVGQSESAQNDQNFLLARYTKDGTPDTTFGGGDGVVTTDFLGGYDDAWGLARTSDGRYVVAGYAENPAGTFDHVAVARYTDDGHLDTTFSGDGKVTTAVAGYQYADVWRCMVQDNGKVVVVGEADDATGNDMLVMRYQENGRLDPSFSGDGRLTIDLGGRDAAWDGQLLDDGTILVAGGSNAPGDGRIALVWITPSGTLDHQEGGGDGTAVVDLIPDNGFELARAAFVLSSGKIVVVGDDSRAGGGHGDLFMARLNANGSKDTTFGGGDGVVVTDAGGDEAMFGARRAGNGQVVAAGETTTPEVRFLVVRFRPDGHPDTAFGANGFAKPFTTFSVADDVEMLSDSRILATGTHNLDEVTVRLLG